MVGSGRREGLEGDDGVRGGALSLCTGKIYGDPGRKAITIFVLVVRIAIFQKKEKKADKG